jgi:hypothetical protein
MFLGELLDLAMASVDDEGDAMVEETHSHRDQIWRWR